MQLPYPVESVGEREPNAVPWGIGRAVGALIVTFACAVGGQIILYALAAGYLKKHQIVANILSYQFLLAGVVLSAVVLILIPYRIGPRALGFRFPGWNTLGMAAVSVVGIMFAVAALEWLFNTLFPAYHLQGNAKQLFPGQHKHLGIVLEVAVVIWAGIEAPLAEETLFRGILFQGMRDTFSRRMPGWAAILIAAVVSGSLFGLAHGEFHTLPILVMLGIILAYVFQLGRSIYASMVVHGLINTLAVIALLHSTS